MGLQLPNISQGSVFKIHAKLRELGNVGAVNRTLNFVENGDKVDILKICRQLFGIPKQTIRIR